MKILLHMCCSNCSISPVEIFRSEDHEFTGYWYNPNIHPSEEYASRLASMKKLSKLWDLDIIFADNNDPDSFFSMFEPGSVPEAPDRCSLCYSLRLEETAREAKKRGFDAFSTTLLISPYQNIEMIAERGRELARQYNIEFYFRDFRPHFRNAQNKSRELGLYRQNYCGCIFSRGERDQRRREKKLKVAQK